VGEPVFRAGPYKDLYIYLLEGVLREEDEDIFGGAFLGNWQEENTSFLFFSRPALEPVARLLRVRPDLEFEGEYYFTYDEWQGAALAGQEIDRFLIVPPWLKGPEVDRLTRIILDPGVVFGNCLHPTTRDCLKALSYLAEKTDLGRVVDLGTGTGILAIAASLLGAKDVLAIDLNPLCVKTARRNIELNGLGRGICLTRGQAGDFLQEPADLVVANIHYDVIKELFEKRLFRKKQRLIFSGLMRSQARETKSQLVEGGFRLLREWDNEMTWFTLLAAAE